MKLGFHPGRVVTLGVAATAIILAIPGSASAQRGAGGGFFNNPGVRLWTALDQRFEEFAKELSLTDAQTESVTELVADFREENKDALGRWTSAMESMRSRGRGAGGGRGTGGGGGGARRPGGGMQEMRGLMQQLTPAMENLHGEVTELLDEEQVKTLAKLLERRPPRG